MSEPQRRDIVEGIVVPDAVVLEAFAQRVADLVVGRIAVGPPLVTAEAVAEHLGVERSWVYDNATRLGARRLGDGPKARMRFSLADVDRLLTCSTGRGSSEQESRLVAATRRRTPTRPLGRPLHLLPVRGSTEPDSPGSGRSAGHS